MPHNASKRTPGPWVVEAGTKASDFAQTVWALDQTGRMLVCRMAGAASFDFANAHLIAAAPELYAALEDMLWPIMAGCQKPTITRCMCAKCVEERARAALAKARGESA